MNISKRTCDCNHYQQSGVPCIHAIVFLRSIKENVKISYFYDFCFVQQLKSMFEANCQLVHDTTDRLNNHIWLNKFAAVVPNIDDMEKFLMD